MEVDEEKEEFPIRERADQFMGYYQYRPDRFRNSKISFSSQKNSKYNKSNKSSMYSFKNSESKRDSLNSQRKWSK